MAQSPEDGRPVLSVLTLVIAKDGIICSSSLYKRWQSRRLLLTSSSIQSDIDPVPKKMKKSLLPDKEEKKSRRVVGDARGRGQGGGRGEKKSLGFLVHLHSESELGRD